MEVDDEHDEINKFGVDPWGTNFDPPSPAHASFPYSQHNPKHAPPSPASIDAARFGTPSPEHAPSRFGLYSPEHAPPRFGTPSPAYASPAYASPPYSQDSPAYAPHSPALKRAIDAATFVPLVPPSPALYSPYSPKYVVPPTPEHAPTRFVPYSPEYAPTSPAPYSSGYVVPPSPAGIIRRPIDAVRFAPPSPSLKRAVEAAMFVTDKKTQLTKMTDNVKSLRSHSGIDTHRRRYLDDPETQRRYGYTPFEKPFILPYKGIYEITLFIGMHGSIPVIGQHDDIIVPGIEDKVPLPLLQIIAVESNIELYISNYTDCGNTSTGVGISPPPQINDTNADLNKITELLNYNECDLSKTGNRRNKGCRQQFIVPKRVNQFINVNYSFNLDALLILKYTELVKEKQDDLDTFINSFLNHSLRTTRKEIIDQLIMIGFTKIIIFDGSCQNLDYGKIKNQYMNMEDEMQYPWSKTDNQLEAEHYLQTYLNSRNIKGGTKSYKSRKHYKSRNT